LLFKSNIFTIKVCPQIILKIPIYLLEFFNLSEFDLIKRTLQEIGQLGEPNPEQVVARAREFAISGMFEFAWAIVSSSPKPVRSNQRASGWHRRWSVGGPNIVEPEILENAIAEAVRSFDVHCQRFVGVIVSRTEPGSRKDANWKVRGVKYGRANREKSNEALQVVVARLRQEFKLTTRRKPR
jgi:hypothetical protein